MCVLRGDHVTPLRIWSRGEFVARDSSLVSRGQKTKGGWEMRGSGSVKKTPDLRTVTKHRFYDIVHRKRFEASVVAAVKVGGNN